MRNIVILAEDTAQITTAEEHATTAVVALETGFFPEMRRNGRYLDGFGADQAVAGGFIAVDVAQAWAEITLSEMRIGGGALFCGIRGGEEVIAGNVVVKEERRGEVQSAPSCT
jgi:hypothetical protein